MQPALDSVEILAARITTRFAAIAASSLRSSGSGLSGAAAPPRFCPSELQSIIRRNRTFAFGSVCSADWFLRSEK